MNYYLAVDIGASSGRHILAHLEDGKMVLEEIHRFPNGAPEVDGVRAWDMDALYKAIIEGMKKCKDAGKIPSYMGIDTWGVDFVLLDEDDEPLGPCVAYRDDRTQGMDEEVYKIIPEAKLYERTGIQKQIFNTIYQLMALKTKQPELLASAQSLLMIPDYLNFLLTGKKAQEYTNATTGQLVDPNTNDWDYELIEKLGYPKEIFAPMTKPGTVLGNLSDYVAAEVGFDCKVVLPCTHDTGSAVVAVPCTTDENVYISSGTWSLLGTELMKADCSLGSAKANFTNEGGYDYRYRYLKNIMGLWMIQSVRSEIAADQSFGDICDAAAKCTIKSIVDANDARFLAPKNMTEEVQAACRETNQQVPEGIAEVACVIYNSLALCYKNAVEEISKMTGLKYDCIHIVGGGSNADYLNRLTAKATGLRVEAGPTEGTAIGNIAVQMITAGELKDLKDARCCIKDSFDIKIYEA